MANFEITSPDGKKFIVTAPEGASQEQVLSYAQQNFKSAPQAAQQPGAIDTLKSNIGGIADYYKNVGMGAVRGASRIGTTLMRPLDATGITGTTHPERVAGIEGFFKENANPESLAFKGGDIGSQIAGTAGVGGFMAKGATAIGAAPKVATALQSGGLSLGTPAATTLPGMAGNAALRTGAGAVTGGAMAGLVDPEQGGTGAIIGGALPTAVKAAGMAGGGLRNAGEHILGAMTGTGTEAIRGAIQAGKTGSQDFLANMRGDVPFDDVVTAAKQGLQNMRKERAAAYRGGMVNIKNDKTVLDMTPINDAVNNIKQSGNFKGKIINQKAGGVIDEIDTVVADWAKSKPADFHTPEGLDALKQAIGDIRDSTQFGTPARRAADSVYNAVKNEIQAQAPTYAKVMKDYSEASATLQEIEGALSLGNNKSKDTAIRKLQSLMRNNAQTNYGNRLELAKTLEDKGGVNLGPSIAGQAMSSWTPRGMVGSIEKGGMAFAPFVAPGALLAAPFTSPRLMGEGLYSLGAMSGGAGNSARGMLGIAGSSNALLEEIMAKPAMRAALLNATNP